MRPLKYFLSDSVQHKAIVHSLYFIGAFLKVVVRNMIFVNLDSRYADYFPECSNYFGRTLISLKYLYGMTNSGKLFFDEFTYWLLEGGFIKSQCQMSIYYKYAPDGTTIIVLFYVDDCIYSYTSEALVKWSVDNL